MDLSLKAAEKYEQEHLKRVSSIEKFRKEIIKNKRYQSQLSRKSLAQSFQDKKINAPMGVICKSCYSKKKLKSCLVHALLKKFPVIQDLKNHVKRDGDSDSDSFESIDFEKRNKWKDNVNLEEKRSPLYQ